MDNVGMLSGRVVIGQNPSPGCSGNPAGQAACKGAAANATNGSAWPPHCRCRHLREALQRKTGTCFKTK